MKTIALTILLASAPATFGQTKSTRIVNPDGSTTDVKWTKPYPVAVVVQAPPVAVRTVYAAPVTVSRTVQKSRTRTFAGHTRGAVARVVSVPFAALRAVGGLCGR